MEIRINNKLKFNNANHSYESEVVKSGTGAVIKSLKKYIGHKVYVVVLEKDNKTETEKTK